MAEAIESGGALAKCTKPDACARTPIGSVENVEEVEAALAPALSVLAAFAMFAAFTILPALAAFAIGLAPRGWLLMRERRGR